MKTGQIMTFAVALMLALASGASAWANESISIPAGADHEGDVETRNGAIRIGDEAVVVGSLETRNGRIETGETVTAGDVYTHNGAIELGAGGRYGRIESRNGRIQLGDGTNAADVESRNGRVDIGAESRTGAIVSRNGSINIGPGAVANGSVKTRNGGVSLAEGSRATGKITTRNGGVNLSDATAEQGVQTLAGNILIEGASRVSGDVVIEISEDNVSRNGGFFGFGGGLSWPESGDIRILDGSVVDGNIVLRLPKDYDEILPTVEIGTGARVTGNLVIDSRAELIVAGTVNGEIERITP